jgi:hypothetical protein
MADLQAWDRLDHSSQVMKTLLSNIDIDLKQGESALLESLSMLRGELTILLKVYPIGSTWRIHFRSIIGVKFFDERDMPEYWHANVEVTPLAAGAPQVESCKGDGRISCGISQTSVRFSMAKYLKFLWVVRTIAPSFLPKKCQKLVSYLVLSE